VLTNLLSSLRLKRPFLPEAYVQTPYTTNRTELAVIAIAIPYVNTLVASDNAAALHQIKETSPN